MSLFWFKIAASSILLRLLILCSLNTYIIVVDSAKSNTLEWPPPPTKTILENAAEWGATKYLELVQQSGLDKTLYNGKGPLTIFAPNNDAFDQLNPDILKQLETNQTFLRDILLYHTVNASVVDNDLRQNERLFPTMLKPRQLRSELYIEGTKVGVWTVSGAMLQYGDVMSTNGVVQGLMSLIYPIPEKVIYDYIKEDSNFTIIKKVIDVAGLNATFKGKIPYSLFAPLDVAFNTLPKSFVDKLLSDPSLAKHVLYNHMINCTVYSVGFFNDQPMRNMDGNQMNFDTDYYNDTITVNNIPVIERDLPVTNGVIHGINGILYHSEANEFLTT
ncbi:transforming growth factor-beta-induced protein ig-h3-like [Glandiceps talaboti]